MKLTKREIAARLRCLGCFTTNMMVRMFSYQKFDDVFVRGNEVSRISGDPWPRCMFVRRSDALAWAKNNMRIEESGWDRSPFDSRILVPKTVMMRAIDAVRAVDVEEHKRPKGYSENRFKDNPEEERFARWWAALNKSGRTLDYLLDPECSAREPRPAPHESHRVAATVIQWLGSPVGQAELAKLGYRREP